MLEGLEHYRSDHHDGEQNKKVNDVGKKNLPDSGKGAWYICKKTHLHTNRYI